MNTANMLRHLGARHLGALLAVAALGLMGCKTADEVAPPPEPDEKQLLAAPDEPPRGVKPHYVKCDPERPEMPCTPDPEPLAFEDDPTFAPAGVKPHYVKCDPERPEMPCTPDPDTRRLEPRAPVDETPPGVKPRYVKCDPERPELPCTPDAAPPPE